MIILLMGVAGAGKTAVGRELASQLGWSFADGDDYHPAENVAKMRNGIPLTDADREPWLDKLRTLIVEWIAEEKSCVLACSALKKVYRDKLIVGPTVRLVYLKADRSVLQERLLGRVGHYMRESMLASQLATLEEPDDAVVVDANQSVKDVVGEILDKIK